MSPVGSHDMYDDEAVLEFPQSGERFEGVANIREWRSRYPGSVTYDIRRIRGADDIWVAEMTVSYDGGECASESTSSKSGTAGSRARRSTSANHSTRPSGGSRLTDPTRGVIDRLVQHDSSLRREGPIRTRITRASRVIGRRVAADMATAKAPE
jgi:hypothetical protein